VHVFNFIYKSVRPFRGQLMLVLFLSSLWAVEVSLKPYFLKMALDSMVVDGGYNQGSVFFFYIGLYLSFLVVMFLINVVTEYIWISAFPKIRARVSVFVFEEFVGQSYTFFQNNFPGRLGNKLNDCIGSIPRIVSLNNEFIKLFLAVIIATYTLYQVNTKYAMALIIWASLYTCISITLAPLVRKRSVEFTAEASRGTGYIIDLMRNMMSIKLFTRQNFEISAVKNHFKEWNKLLKSRDMVLLNLYALQSFTFIVFQCLCVYWMWKSSLESQVIPVGDFVLFFSISFAIYDCLRGVARTIADYSGDVLAVSDALDTVYAMKETKDKPDAVLLECPKGQIEIDDVLFHYNRIHPIFKRLSIKIEAGQKIGLVGFSGGGKSTLVNLILRLYDVTCGRICIDGQDVRDVTQDSLRKNIAMIPQDPTLLHGSLMDNIRYGRDTATDEEVIEAAKKAHAHEFIVNLPDQYDALVGENGVLLSVGQRQRIVMARAILKNAPILIMDEATSQFDTVTKGLIQKSLKELMENKTTIVIAHRLSTLLAMDRILVFSKGKVVEDGSHAQLLEQNGLYKKLWNTQVNALIPDKKQSYKLPRL
jgi:ATP-binding cassette, subfamily B, bacterial